MCEPYRTRPSLWAPRHEFRSETESVPESASSCPRCVCPRARSSAAAYRSSTGDLRGRSDRSAAGCWSPGERSDWLLEQEQRDGENAKQENDVRLLFASNSKQELNCRQEVKSRAENQRSVDSPDRSEEQFETSVWICYACMWKMNAWWTQLKSLLVLSLWRTHFFLKSLYASANWLQKHIKHRDKINLLHFSVWHLHQ